MKPLLSILCLFVLSCDSDGDDICSYENACNYGENAECYYFFPADSVDDGDEYHCGDMQVLQDIIDINTSDDFPLSEVGEYFITQDNEEGTVQSPYCTLSETGRVAGIVLNHSILITALPESIGNLESLIELRLDHNHLISLPESIGDLSSLVRLYLQYNDLTSLPESICNIPETCQILVFNNHLCEEYRFDCIGNWDNGGIEPQDQSNCCEGVNDEGETVDNWTTCP